MSATLQHGPAVHHSSVDHRTTVVSSPHRNDTGWTQAVRQPVDCAGELVDVRAEPGRVASISQADPVEARNTSIY